MIYAKIALLLVKGYNQFMAYLERKNLIEQGKQIERDLQIIKHETRIRYIRDIKRLARANKLRRKK